MATLITADRSNLRAGEEEVVRALVDGLPDSWDVACTLVVPSGEDSRELDAVVIAPRAVYVVEVKNSPGMLRLTATGLERSGRVLSNPYHQVDGATKALAGYLRGRSPEFESVPGKPVHAHIVLSHPDARLLHVQDEIAHQVSMIDGVVDDLASRHESATTEIPTAARTRIRNLLSSTAARDVVPERIGSWTIGDQQTNSVSSRTFEAVHDDGSDYLIRLLRPRNTLDRAYAERERAGLLREYQALSDLAGHGVCPRVLPYEMLDSGEILVPIRRTQGRSLGEEIADGHPPGAERVHEVVAAAYRSLAILHEARPAVVHRALTPDRVVITPSGSVQFTGFQVAHIDERTGLTTVLGEIDPDDEQEHHWRAPEARNDLAWSNVYSDVWSLATVLRAWVIGSARSGDLKKHTISGPVRDRLGAELSDRFADLLRTARAETGRPTAHDIADAWSSAQDEPAADGPTADEPEVPLCRREMTVGDVIEGRYVLIRELGAGGTAKTFLVNDLDVDEMVVLKSFDFDRVPHSLALQEFRKAKSLVHEHVVVVREYRKPSRAYHLVVDFAPGVELGDHEGLHDDAESLASIADGLLDALGYIHEKGYLHRDVSPRNVIVELDDPTSVKLIDFGMASLSAEATTGHSGTFGFVAPEVVREQTWTPSADVYSAGVVLYRALTGEWPFEMNPAPVHEQLREPPEDLSPASSALARVLLVAVQPSPSARYPDAGEFRAAVQELTERLQDDDAVLGGEARAEASIDGHGASGEVSDVQHSDDPGWLTELRLIPDQQPMLRSADDDTTDDIPTDPGRTSEVVPSPGGVEGVDVEAHVASRPTVFDASSDVGLRVADVEGCPRLHDGNVSFGIGRLRKYSLGLDGTVRGVLASGGAERTLYAKVPIEFATMVNAAKAMGGQSAGGTFVIDHGGNVIVGSGGRIWLAGRVEGVLAFDDGDRVISPVPPAGMSPGQPWDGLGVGMRYKLNAATTDFAYENATGGWTWLGEQVGADSARSLARGMGRHKPSGGRIYVNEAGAVFGPMPWGSQWREVYLGRVAPDDWFPSRRRVVPTETADMSHGPRVSGYRAFWQRLLDRVGRDHPDWTKAGARDQSWFNLRSGEAGVVYVCAFSRGSMHSSIYFDHADAVVNDARYEELARRRGVLEAVYGGPLLYEPKDGSKASAVGACRPGGVQDVSEWDDHVDWFVSTQVRLRSAIMATGGIPVAE